jgi:hypothetical protein
MTKGARKKGTTMLTAMDAQFIPTLNTNCLFVAIRANFGASDAVLMLHVSEIADVKFHGVCCVRL